MIQTVNNSDFHNAFNRMDRGSQFSYEALNLIYEYLEQYEQDTDVKVELDVIAICCEYSESDPIQIAKDCNIALEGESDIPKHVLEVLYDHTTVVGVCPNGSIVFQQF
jgi:Zn finger protein HypA/HybF involved in hydrogenase expression